MITLALINLIENLQFFHIQGCFTWRNYSIQITKINIINIITITTTKIINIAKILLKIECYAGRIANIRTLLSDTVAAAPLSITLHIHTFIACVQIYNLLIVFH